MVYRLYHDDQETYSYGTEALDGDMKKVGAIDQTRDKGVRIRPWSKYAGRTVGGTQHLPTKIKLEGPKRPITDFYEAGSYLIDEKFKTVVENLEPNVHQFFPMEIVWKDGSHAANRYWFIPCNRLDSVDREKTTKEFRNLWVPASEGEYIFNRSQIGNHHVWIDKFMTSTMGVLISNKLKEELEKAGVTGMGFNAFEETD